MAENEKVGVLSHTDENGNKSYLYPKVKTDTSLTEEGSPADAATVGSRLASTLTEAKGYTDTKITDLINGAPTTLDTLKEIADAMAENEDVVETLNAAVGSKVDKVDGKGLSTNDYTTTEKTKLSGIATGAEVNQNTFSNVKVGSTTVSADSKTDTLELVAGSNVTITPDATNDKITISSTDTKYTHPTYTAKSSGLYKVTVDGTGHVSGATAVTKADITALGIPASDTNTHYASKNVVGSSTATSNTTSALTNGNVYLNSVENGAVTSTHKISGSGATTVTTDASGNIVISSTDTNTNTDTKVTQTVKTDNANYPLLLAPSGQTATTTTTACFDSGVTLNPSTNTIAANVSGNAGTATKLATARTIDGVSFDGSANITHYGTCSTAAATVEKVVACTGFVLATGATIKVRFTVTNTANNPTLNVNSTGAKNIRYRNGNIAAGYLAANRTYEFVYDGSYYQVVGDLDANTWDRIRYNGAIKCSTTAIVANNLIVGSNGTYQHLKLGKAFDITYPILFAASGIAASGTGTNNYKVIPMTITTTQSITLTAYKPVYIKGKLSGTTFTPVSTTPLTQTVPTSADGYQYILVGLAYSTTQMMLEAENPIYEYSNGVFGLYGGSSASSGIKICESEPASMAAGQLYFVITE